MFANIINTFKLFVIIMKTKINLKTKMSEFVAYLTIVIACLSPGPGSVSGQGQKTDVKVLERGDDWQCPPMEERERAKKEIHQIANSAILATIATGHIHTCNGTPGDTSLDQLVLFGPIFI